jgi:outer membrane protein assembly factor BamA
MKLRCKALLILLLIAQSVWSGLPGEELKPYDGKIVRNIFIHRKNVFDDKIGEKTRFYYRWGNSLHYITRESVIRQELLFTTGNPLELEKLVESQRNLRLKGFLGDVEFKAISVGPDSVDLDITTTDLWTTKAELYFDLAGGNYATAIGATESNLFGLGKMIQFSAEKGSDQSGFFLSYYDHRLLGSRLALDMSYSDYTYSKDILFSLNRPQYSLSVPFGFKTMVSFTRSRPRLFYRGEEYFIYRQDKNIVSLAGAYTFGRNNRLSIIPGYDYEEQNFSEDKPGLPLNAYIPPDETMSYPSLGIRVATLKYGVEKYLDSAGNPEDMAYGAALKYRFGQSANAFGADYYGYYQFASAQFLCKPRNWLYFGGLDEVAWWGHNGRSERIRHISKAALYLKPAESHTLAIAAQTDFAWRQRNAYQVYLGGGNGLRGFSFYEFAGTKLAVSNIEYRFYTPLEIMTVKIGGAAFYDFGNVWRQSENIDLGELKSDVGIGFRFGLTKSSTARVVNLDFARSLSDSGYYITMSSLATFNINFANIGE